MGLEKQKSLLFVCLLQVFSIRILILKIFFRTGMIEIYLFTEKK